jgi:WXG100 family type VII secretion target
VAKKTLTSIALDFNKAKTQASKLEEISRKVKQERNNLESAKKMISSSWKSDNSNAYLNKIAVVENELSNIEKNLNQIASTVRTIAQNTYNSEKKAITLANQRTYK